MTFFSVTEVTASTCILMSLSVVIYKVQWCYFDDYTVLYYTALVWHGVFYTLPACFSSLYSHSIFHEITLTVKVCYDDIAGHSQSCVY